MGLKAAQKVRQVRHNSSANFELENVGRTFELKAEPATPWNLGFSIKTNNLFLAQQVILIFLLLKFLKVVKTTKIRSFYSLKHYRNMGLSNFGTLTH